MVKVLMQRVCPQSTIHGWSGLVLLPMVYALLKPNPFVAPADPGAVAVYAQFCITGANQNRKGDVRTSVEQVWLVQNIMRACFPMLDGNVVDQFKIFNVPTLIGWNTNMTIQEILDQLDGTHEKPDTMLLLTNNTHFLKPVQPSGCT
jgi:hypothetical protein